MVATVVLYRRELPGGGVVAIEELPENGESCRARIFVERRGDLRRREGHTPPVIAELTGSSRARIFGDLYEIASSNVAIARGLLQWQLERGPSLAER